MCIKTLILIFIMREMKAVEAGNNTQSNGTFPGEYILKTKNKTLEQSVNRYSKIEALREKELKDTGGYCRSFNKCFDCVKSLRFSCGWCHNYGCTDISEEICPFAEIETERFNITGVTKACPYVEHEGPLIIPEGIRTKIKVKLYIPNPEIYDKAIICKIRIRDRMIHLKGVIVNDIVHCNPVVLHSFDRSYGELDTGYLTVIWGGAQPYSNHIPLTVYNCETMAVYCETCSKIPAEYGCGWCDSIEKCVIEEKCVNGRYSWSQNRLPCTHTSEKLENS